MCVCVCVCLQRAGVEANHAALSVNVCSLMCALESQNEGIHSSREQSERSEGCVPELNCVNVFKVCVCVCVCVSLGEALWP